MSSGLQGNQNLHDYVIGKKLKCSRRYPFNLSRSFVEIKNSRLPLLPHSFRPSTPKNEEITPDLLPTLDDNILFRYRIFLIVSLIPFLVCAL